MHKTITLSDAVEKIPDGASGGGLFAMSFYGAEKVIEHYNLMGPVRAALESAVRYLACELGPKVIRVHAISPGPMRTRAASGIDYFDYLIESAAKWVSDADAELRT